MALNSGVQMETQVTDRNVLPRQHHWREEPWCEGVRCDHGDDSDGGGAHCADSEPMRWRKAEDLGGRNKAAAMTSRGECGDLEVRGGAGAIEGGGRA